MTDVYKFHLGQIVSHALECTKRGIVTGIVMRQHGPIYLVTWEDLVERWNYDFELAPGREVYPQ